MSVHILCPFLMEYSFSVELLNDGKDVEPEDPEFEPEPRHRVKLLNK